MPFRAVLLLSAVLSAAAQPRVQPRTYPSAIFGGERRVIVYTPPAGDRPPAGLVICLWGQDYADQIAAPATLDALIRDRRIPPIAAILVDDGTDRFQEFQTTQKTARSIVEELLPWARSTLKIDVDAAHTIVAGYSAAGLAATYTGFSYPQAIGNVLAQSGAFWRGFEGQGGEQAEWLAVHYAEAPRRDTRFSLEVGGAETRDAGGSGISIKTANEHLRDVLLKKGYSVAYREVPGAQHEYGHWKAAFGPALEALAKDWRLESGRLISE
jgi:enterochelin esterase family protein